MVALDEETEFMMLEPGERRASWKQEKSIRLSFRLRRKRCLLLKLTMKSSGFVVGVGAEASKSCAMLCRLGCFTARSGRTRFGYSVNEDARILGEGKQIYPLGAHGDEVTHNDRAKSASQRQEFQVEGMKQKLLRVDKAVCG